MDKFSDDSTCRICLKKQDTVYCLFRKRKGLTPSEQLSKIGFKTDINDAKPPCICCECLTELDITLNFLGKCETSNQILSEHYNRGVNVAQDIEAYKGDSNIAEPVAIENNISYTESRPVEVGEDVDTSVSEAMKAVELAALEDARCAECGSRRRCPHWAPPATHTCPYCQKVFTRKFNFKLHLKRHSGSREWWCLRCGAGAVSRWLAGAHCAPRRRRACPVPGCGKTYTTNTNLNTHLRVHSGERPFECADCGKKFTSKNTLSDHVRIHTGALPYICPICGKQFRTNKLSAHMSTHTGGGPRLACARAGCGKRFASRRALQRHTHTHTAPGSVPPRPPSPQHACALCPARYHHKQSLNKHVKKQHTQKPVEMSAEAENEIPITELSKEVECNANQEYK
ncbi:unnamed protein product [Chrysodeixis includens]|uniref:Uncharacterized protein n=1 Tax=Chrysodeixis includens TaxID=689277 RepID=A0A9P0C5V7_CHRIL|nr:unnamed protein product [Chrysodeixis includens]